MLKRGGAVFQAISKELNFLEENPFAPGAIRELAFLDELAEALAIEHCALDEPTEKDFEELERRMS